MSTASEQPASQATKEEERPTITFTHIISTVNTGSFGGWGPKVNSTPNIFKSWN
ncbi:MAG TPA: hypothetical protein VIG51_04215 [Candidatus Baltobacteraceae bacterium]